MGLQVLVVCDDHWHPARTPRAGLAPLEAAGFAFDWIESATEWSAARMAAYPVVLLTKANNVSASDDRPWLTEEVQRAFEAYVGQGRGLLAVHSGMGDVAPLPVLRGLLGGAFVRHPPQCPVTVQPRADHALTSGSAPFTLVDEHYIMDLDDSAADVFLTTRSEHGTQPAGWRRTAGAGRVCVLTPGHNLEVWLHPAAQALIGNALRWCAGVDRAGDG
ncbi:MAG TPA: ThuA domain-containing protein [Chloroflexia bacterium]|nr:ThuA domain-containing protein [Chloroflexia bacterium]